MILFYIIYVYVLYELFFTPTMLCELLSYVNMCACHVSECQNSISFHVFS